MTYPWVTRAPDGIDSAYCQLCTTSLYARWSNLANHEGQFTMKISALKGTSPIMFSQPSSNSNSKSDQLKKAELQQAVAMACHSSMATVDHIGEIIAAHGEGSSLGQSQLHRTKCTKLLSEVVAPAFFNDLNQGSRGEPFALLTDASMDSMTAKHLCVVIRYYSEKERVMTDMLGLPLSPWGYRRGPLHCTFSTTGACSVSVAGLHWLWEWWGINHGWWAQLFVEPYQSGESKLCSDEMHLSQPGSLCQGGLRKTAFIHQLLVKWDPSVVLQ